MTKTNFEMLCYSLIRQAHIDSLETTELLIDKSLNLELITTGMTSQSQCTF
jgi:hypothetical protein